VRRALSESEKITIILEADGIREFPLRDLMDAGLIPYVESYFRTLGNKSGRVPKGYKVGKKAKKVLFKENEMYAWKHFGDDWADHVIPARKNGTTIPDHNVDKNNDNGTANNDRAKKPDTAKPAGEKKPSEKPGEPEGLSSETMSEIDRGYYAFLKKSYWYFWQSTKRKIEDNPHILTRLMILLAFILIASFIAKLGFKI
jgi:hypothetical protein